LSYADALAVGEAIDAAVGGGGRLRPDARIFLYVNLHQMVTLPLSHPGSPVRFNPETAEGLVEDCAQILQASTKFQEGNEILSAASVLRGTATVLDKLHLKSWRLWDRDG
jgi:hypothetical protein